MAKKTQKSVYFSGDVFDWFNEMERETGASHSRIALAALLAYARSDDYARRWWMQVAVSVDRGEMSFQDALRQYDQFEVKQHEYTVKFLQEHGLPQVENAAKAAKEFLRRLGESAELAKLRLEKAKHS